MIEAYTLFSGSLGNSLLIRSGGTVVLVDAGRSRRAVLLALKEISLSTADIAAVFVTHEHTDHTAALAQIRLRDGLAIHASAATAAYLDGSVFGEATVLAHPPVWTEAVGELEITSFPLPHDSRCAVGYRFRDRDGDAFCTATDAGTPTDELLGALGGCRGALLEANYDPLMLRCGPYPATLKSRILSPIGHMSNEDCAAVARFAADCGVKHIGLGHLSAENNTPEKAYAAVRDALAGREIELVVCARSGVTRIM